MAVETVKTNFARVQHILDFCTGIISQTNTLIANLVEDDRISVDTTINKVGELNNQVAAFDFTGVPDAMRATLATQLNDLIASLEGIRRHYFGV